MSKMMMGQIDHAKKRVQEIKNEKRGKAPKKPSIRGGSDVLKAIRDGDVSVSAGRLREAFDAFLDRVVAATVVSIKGTYQNDYTDTYKISEVVPTSVENALANIVYAKENGAEIARFEAETAEYKRISEILNDRSAVVEDAIVLGDQHAALQALQEFAAFNPEDFKAL